MPSDFHEVTSTEKAIPLEEIESVTPSPCWKCGAGTLYTEISGVLIKCRTCNTEFWIEAKDDC